jgi:N-hydroxyarylamine O-acetyltransferase
MDVDQYLHRIGYTGPHTPTAETLRALHRAHMLSVPFETLDIALGRPIVLDESALFEKIVTQRRGGFCYELNGLFAWLLRTLGFRVDRLNARVYESATPGPEFDHMALLVHLEQRWLTDVGFGDCFHEPLLLDEAGEQNRNGYGYRITPSARWWLLTERKPPADWQPSYDFDLQPRDLREYDAMCRYQQTSPDSIFTQKRVCSRATPAGRISLSNQRLILTHNGTRTERELSEAEYSAALRAHFGITLPAPHA